MRFQINDSKAFKPVTIELTCETLEELQEFQCRMALHKGQITQHIPELNKVSGIGSSMSGITKLRMVLINILGRNSIVDVA